jgi:hypothetical protein
MLIGSQEHDDILAQFEKNYQGLRFDREKDLALWKKGQVYENGETNALYGAYIMGYSFGRLKYLY